MNINTSKGIYAVMLLLVGVGATLPAAATSTGPRLLGLPSTAVDVFTFTCPTTTRSAIARVEDLTSIYNVKARMQFLLLKDSLTAHAEDNTPVSIGGEGGLPSSSARLYKGPGRYLMLVFKTAAGAEAYSASVVCNTTSVVPFNPDIQATQNQ